MIDRGTTVYILLFIAILITMINLTVPFREPIPAAIRVFGLILIWVLVLWRWRATVN